MKQYQIEKRQIKEFRLYECENDGKKLIGIFENESEAKFHKDIREKFNPSPR